ncbi:MAG: Fe-S cluster assembly protein SufD, partial [Alphaproteobacteria bacterium]|nr:Fe-S cluster assembly protein SufD [Alphaproteobacteria bacterium]
YFCGLTDVAKHPFAALNQAYLQEGVYINIEKNVELKRPLVIINHTDSEQENLLLNLHNIIVLEQGAEATLVEYYIYDGDPKSRYFTNVVNEIYLSPNSRFYHNKIQNEAFKASHIALNLVSAKKDSLYKSFCLQKGANIGRNETLVRLKEEGATAEVNAAYIMNGWATLDTTTDIEHLSPCTYSHQLIKGVVGGNAKGVFQGKIHIAQDAIKTEGNQLHKALLLSDDAEVDVKPELEIFADDVKCSHGAASGELDENQLFYMRSRGIGLEEAKQILIDAYLDEVTTKIDNEKISAWIKLIAKENRK